MGAGGTAPSFLDSFAGAQASGYPALEVLLDDGVLQLFWYYELEPLDEGDRGARRQSGAAAGPQARGPFNPIEQAFSKLKDYLRGACARSQ